MATCMRNNEEAGQGECKANVIPALLQQTGMLQRSQGRSLKGDGATRVEDDQEVRNIIQAATSAEVVYADLVVYRCAEGYRVDPHDHTTTLQNTFFVLQMDENDDYVPFPPGNPKLVLQCLPVECKAWQRAAGNGFPAKRNGFISGAACPDSVEKGHGIQDNL